MKKILALFLLSGSISFVYAQKSDTNKVLADAVVAVVGDGVIVKSDIDNRIFDLKKEENATKTLPTKDTFCYFLASQIQTKVLALQALRDSLPFNEEYLEQNLEGRIAMRIQKYGSKEALEKIVGKSIFQLKEDLRQEVKEQLLAEMAQGELIKNIRITPSEVEKYYETIPKEQLRYKESQFEINQLVVNPKPSKAEEEKIIALMNTWKKDLEEGKVSFVEMVNKYSDDHASKQTGGQFSINKDQGGFDPTFMAASFKLKEGQISPVVKTAFGYHLIQMVSRVGSDAVVRHIIKVPMPGDKEIRAAIESLDSLRNQVLIKEKLAFNIAVNKYSDDENLKYTGGAVVLPTGGGAFETKLSIDQMPDKQMAETVVNMKAGDISEVQLFQNPMTGKLQLRILYLRSKSEPHRENLADDYEDIAQRALKTKQMAALKQWFDRNVGHFYIKVDKDYLYCDDVKEWVMQSEKNMNHFAPSK